MQAVVGKASVEKVVVVKSQWRRHSEGRGGKRHDIPHQNSQLLSTGKENENEKKSVWVGAGVRAWEDGGGGGGQMLMQLTFKDTKETSMPDKKNRESW